jgi:hypothetical protein
LFQVIQDDLVPKHGAATFYFAEDKLSPNGKTPVVQAEVWLKSLGIP